VAIAFAREGADVLIAYLNEDVDARESAGWVEKAGRRADQEGMFTVGTDNGVLLSRYVLLATGVRDHLPAIEGAENAVTRSVLRVCPICDAFEAIDQRIAIIGGGAMAEREAEFLRYYSDRVTVLDIGNRTAS